MYRYPDLPRQCICMRCGHVISNPGRHCADIEVCPRCGSYRPFRRAF